MNARKHREDVPRALCARAEEGDGERPERKDSRAREPGRKDMQLCKQVLRAVQGALDGSADPLLRELEVLAVEPAPDAGRLRVSVCPKSAPGPTGAEITAGLARAKGYIREEVASAITRKRAPELAFAVVAREEVDHGE